MTFECCWLVGPLTTTIHRRRLTKTDEPTHTFTRSLRTHATDVTLVTHPTHPNQATHATCATHAKHAKHATWAPHVSTRQLKATRGKTINTENTDETDTAPLHCNSCYVATPQRLRAATQQDSRSVIYQSVLVVVSTQDVSMSGTAESSDSRESPAVGYHSGTGVATPQTPYGELLTPFDQLRTFLCQR